MADKKSRQAGEDKATTHEPGAKQATNRDSEILRIVHQLNQPLTAINNYAQAGSQLIANGMADPQRMKELFEKIAAQCSRTRGISQELSETVHGET